ncbi:LysR family transcriptional regulator [Thalassospira sp. UBA1131]|uniref:LysR family transcriptional regulator n=1 Tax=Thalassospira sp. UBA1131 TaxID=1947672 RepID=UPI0025FFEEC4|nr:LysR family transcriptional regulator [Thalassospira sp. UBA1131]
MNETNLHRLQIFRTVFENSHNISAAARKLKLAQPTVSRHLAIFEDELRVSLYRHEGGRIEPTWEAQRLYAETGQLFERVAQVDHTVESIRRGEDESLRIMSVMTLSLSLVPTAIADLNRQLPNLDIIIEGGGAVSQLIALRSGTIDVAIGGLLPPSPDLRQTPFGECALTVMLPTEHPLCAQDEIHLKDLAGHSCILPNPDAPLGRRLYDLMEEHDTYPAQSISAFSLAFAVGLAGTTRRITIVDTQTAHDFSNDSLVSRPMVPETLVSLATIELARSPKRRSISVLQESLRNGFGTQVRTR